MVKPAAPKQKHLCIVVNPLSAKIKSDTSGQGPSSDQCLATHVLDTLRREISDCLNSPKIVLWKELPGWVVETTKGIFNEVFKALAIPQQLGSDIHANETGKSNTAGQLCGAKDETAYSYIFNVVATLICFDSVGVREVSCSPLPMMAYSPTESNFSEEVLADLQRGMAINPAVTTHFDGTSPPAKVLSTAIGIAVLRVLSGVSKSQRPRIEPMILQKRGCGIDEEDSNLKVSIVVGATEGNECGSDKGISLLCADNNSGGESSLFHFDRVTHLETNLDDISGEHLAFAIELLLQHGAIDAWVTPIVMKKGRPAHTLHCLCKENSESHLGGSNSDRNENGSNNATLNTLLELIFVHTSTLGVRIYRGLPRAKLDRSMVSVTTPFTNTSRKGRVDVKVSRFKNGRIVRKKAEFDHCKEIATEEGVGIKVVADEAINAYDSRRSNT
jgi:hypothetical protein